MYNVRGMSVYAQITIQCIWDEEKKKRHEYVNL